MEDNNVTQNLANIIMNARKKRNLTLRQLAYKTNLSASYISQLERGLRALPAPDRIKSLSTALNIDYEYLMKEVGYIEKEETNTNDTYDLLMFSDKEAFDSLPEEHKERILNSLRDQADYLIDKAKRGK